MPHPAVVFQPNARAGLQRGINQLTAAIRSTIGPYGRPTLVERSSRNFTPSLLDDGGTIARRINELPQRDADTGAMLLRNLLWRVVEDVGDGTATAALLFQEIFNSGTRYLAAGGDPMRLRRALERGLEIVLAELRAQATPISGREPLVQLAEAACHDLQLAEQLGEVFDIIGEHGVLEIRPGRGRTLGREYIEGAYWPAPLLSPTVLHDLSTNVLRFEHAGLLITDCEIEEPSTLLPVLERAQAMDLCGLIIIAQRISERALGLLLANREVLPTAVVRVPGTRPDEQMSALADLALLTGGRPLLQIAGQCVRHVRREDIGQARRAWVDQHHVGVASGAGTAHARRAQIAQLSGALAAATKPEQRAELQQRVGRLMGGAATLWIGGATETEIKTRSEQAERGAHVLRSALGSGVVPGGGSALLACLPILEHMRQNAADADTVAAFGMLAQALAAPFRAIAANAGYEPSEVLARARQAGKGGGLDVRSGQIVDMRQAGIVDSAGVVLAAARCAISSAALALTIDVVIHPGSPEIVTEP